jgi:hypothetical protein
MTSIKKLWQHRVFIIAFIIPCLLSPAILEFNSCITGSPSHIIKAINDDSYVLPPIILSDIDRLLGIAHSKISRKTNPSLEKLFFIAPYGGPNKFFVSTYSESGLLDSVHRKSSQQFCRLIDIPPPFA